LMPLHQMPSRVAWEYIVYERFADGRSRHESQRSVAVSLEILRSGEKSDRVESGIVGTCGLHCASGESERRQVQGDRGQDGRPRREPLPLRELTTRRDSRRPSRLVTGRRWTTEEEAEGLTSTSLPPESAMIADETVERRLERPGSVGWEDGRRDLSRGTESSRARGHPPEAAVSRPARNPDTGR
jgi:hypothetical protein